MQARASWLVIAAIALFPLLAGGPARPAPRTPAEPLRAGAGRATRPNVIMIVVDTLRADHLPAYGYARLTTPNLDAYLTDRGVVFRDVTSPSPWTCPANGGLAAGRDPTRLGISWRSWADALRPEVDTLAEYLDGAGYVTAGFATNGYASARTGFAQGFDYFDTSLVTHTHAISTATALTDLAIRWTQGYTGAAPLFLWVYYMDPHTWYNPPSPYDIMWDSTYTGTVTPEVYDDGYGVITGELELTPRDLYHVLALYDGEIAYTDAQIGRLLVYLDARGLLDDALIVFTADHGEMFGEHRKWVHGNSVYEAVLRVPLLMRYTGVITPGLRLNTPVQSMDVMPTIQDYLGIPITGTAPLQAISLRPLIDGQEPPVPRPVFAEVDAMGDPEHWAYLNAPRTDLRAMRAGRWKYIFHVTDPAADELYYLEAGSPYETVNLIGGEPARAAQMRQAIQNWFGLNRVYLPGLPFLPGGASRRR